MADRYELVWVDKNAEKGPVFKIGRDTYEREFPGQSVIWLRAVESYPARVAPVAARAFSECAREWGAPITFIIEPNLAKPPAARFLFEWSRSVAANSAVERSYMKTSNTVSRFMGRLVLRLFTDGTLPFEAIEGQEAVETRLKTHELSCPRAGFKMPEPGTSMVLSGDAAPGLMRSLMRRAANRLRGRPTRKSG